MQTETHTQCLSRQGQRALLTVLTHALSAAVPMAQCAGRGRLARRWLSHWGVVWGVSVFVVLGCATAYELPQLTTQHPAHPGATAAPAASPSTTLAYTPADMPAPQPPVRTAQSGMPHPMHGTGSAAAQSQATVVGDGKVIAVVPSSGQLVVEHGPIKDFMDAMTMGYRVEPLSLLEGLQAGDAIRFTIDPQQKVIVKIEKR